MKKAQINYIKLLILAIVFLLIMIPLIVKVRKAAEGASRITECKASVEAHARAHIMGFDLAAEIRCPTKELLVKTNNPTTIKSTLANEMAECWDIFKEGKHELFDIEGVYCAICSRIKFKETNMKIDGFAQYLVSTPKPSQKPGNKLTYADYLAGYKTPSAESYAEDILSKRGTDMPIDTSKNYSTLFVYAKGKDAMSNLKDAVGGTGKAMAITGVASGAAAGIAVVLLGSNPIGWVTAGAIVVGAGIAAVWTYFAGEPPEWMALTVLTEYTQEELSRYNCKYLEVEQS